MIKYNCLDRKILHRRRCVLLFDSAIIIDTFYDALVMNSYPLYNKIKILPRVLSFIYGKKMLWRITLIATKQSNCFKKENLKDKKL